MMFKAHCEYIWHITCNKCSFYWTMAVMKKGFKPDRGDYSCPMCHHKGRIEVDEEPNK